MSYVGLKKVVLNGSVLVRGDEETLIDEDTGVTLTVRFNQEGETHPAGYRDGMPQHLLLELTRTRYHGDVFQTSFSEERHEVRVMVQWLNDLEKIVSYTVLER